MATIINIYCIVYTYIHETAKRLLLWGDSGRIPHGLGLFEIESGSGEGRMGDQLEQRTGLGGRSLRRG